VLLSFDPYSSLLLYIRQRGLVGVISVNQISLSLDELSVIAKEKVVKNLAA